MSAVLKGPYLMFRSMAGVLVLFIILVFFPSASVNAQESAPSVSTSAVRVGIYVVNVGRLDLATGTFTVDFYLTFRCDSPCDPTDFEFMNGRTPFVDKQVDEPQELIYRIQANLRANMDLREYPFDTHDLTIIFEDKNLTSEQQIYVVDPETSGIDPAVSVAGWQLRDAWHAKVDDHFYPPWSENFSRYTFAITIERAALSAILKSLLPAIAIVVTGLLALVISPVEIMMRLTVNTSAFVGAVLFHLNLTSSIPPLGYLTYADKFMIINYLALLLALTATLTLMRVSHTGNELKIRRVHTLFLFSTPSFWLVLQSINFFLL